MRLVISASLPDTGQRTALDHLWDTVIYARTSVPTPGTAPIPRVERGHLLWPWQHWRTEGAWGAVGPSLHQHLSL